MKTKSMWLVLTLIILVIFGSAFMYVRREHSFYLQAKSEQALCNEQLIETSPIRQLMPCGGCPLRYDGWLRGLFEKNC